MERNCPACSRNQADDRSLQLGRFLRERADRPSRKARAGGLDHLGHFLEENGQVLGPARQERDEPQDRGPDCGNDKDGEQGHDDDLARAPMHKPTVVARREQMHELVDQQSSEQRCQQMELQGT